MSSNQEQYTAARDELLAKIIAFLKDDPRFLAAWLAGSFGRGEQTWLSDKENWYGKRGIASCVSVL